MKTPLLLAFFALTACGSGPLPPVMWVNDSQRPTSNAEDVWAATEGVLGDSINLDGFTVHIHAHVGEGCNEAAECTNPEAYSMTVAFPTAIELGLDESTADMTIAGAMCHELMHVYCYQTSGDGYCGIGEADHQHKAPFDYNLPGSICYQVANLFAGGFE